VLRAVVDQLVLVAMVVPMVPQTTTAAMVVLVAQAEFIMLLDLLEHIPVVVEDPVKLGLEEQEAVA
jgi:hypothetical protein